MALRILMGYVAAGDDVQAEKGTFGAEKTKVYLRFCPFILGAEVTIQI